MDVKKINKFADVNWNAERKSERRRVRGKGCRKIAEVVTLRDK